MDSHPFLETLKKRGIIQGLDRMYNALSEINNPQMSQKGALIGGTNGKGSTSFILYNLLYSHGFRTALYTSPHIREINDRYLSDGKVISDEKLVYYIENLGFLAEKYRLTLFEFETLIAFRYFSDINTDFSVYEVGMGGRLDATNCFDPKIKIITSVSKDHTEYLGNTEESILYEKAGIIKKNNIVITGIDNPRLLTILRGYCHKRNATLLESDKDFYAENVREDEGFEIFDYYYKDLCLKNLKLSLFGRYQVTNCALSLTAFAEIMNIYGHKIFTDKIYETLSNIRFRGRFEIYSREPLIIIDGAHNIDGIKKLIKSIITFNREKRKILIIFSTLSNKDPLEKITLLKDIAHRFIFIENNHPLSLKNEEFIMLARKADLRYSETMNIGTAIEKIFDEYRDYLTVITGSLYTLSEVYNELERLGKNGKR